MLMIATLLVLTYPFGDSPSILLQLSSLDFTPRVFFG